ncbi:MAG: serine hydrolase domain-containing protein [Candidatus Tyrphobacter sp.]
MSRAFAGVDALLREACGTAFTAAVARIEHAGRLRFERAYGVTRTDAQARPVFADTRFDLASLTKLFTATLALRAVSDERIALDASLQDLFPEWRGTPHAAITLRMLLAHDSGMNSGADYRLLLDHNVEEFTIREPLSARPGERVIYSDLGFIAVGMLLERLHRRSLASVVAHAFARPNLAFRPGAGERGSIPATEDDGWRGRVQGYVHDEKAYLMGGVAGHAGLFASAADVAWLAEAYLGPLRGRSSSLLPPSMVAQATCEQAWDPVLRRGLGWALKTTDENSCGRLFSPGSFGHTGFVGTCVWADPQRDLQCVLLTNGVYFGRNDTRDLRAAFCETAASELS